MLVFGLILGFAAGFLLAWQSGVNMDETRTKLEQPDRQPPGALSPASRLAIETCANCKFFRRFCLQHELTVAYDSCCSLFKLDEKKSCVRGQGESGTPGPAEDKILPPRDATPGSSLKEM